jgi:hypothetical protein
VGRRARVEFVVVESCYKLARTDGKKLVIKCRGW